MSTAQADLDFCSDYLDVPHYIKIIAHTVGWRIDDGEYRRANMRVGFTMLIQSDCVKYGGYEGMLLHWGT